MAAGSGELLAVYRCRLGREALRAPEPHADRSRDLRAVLASDEARQAPPAAARQRVRATHACSGWRDARRAVAGCRWGLGAAMSAAHAPAASASAAEATGGGIRWVYPTLNGLPTLRCWARGRGCWRRARTRRRTRRARPARASRRWRWWRAASGAARQWPTTSPTARPSAAAATGRAWWPCSSPAPPGSSRAGRSRRAPRAPATACQGQGQGMAAVRARAREAGGISGGALALSSHTEHARGSLMFTWTGNNLPQP
jgi:hypothetical protein